MRSKCIYINNILQNSKYKSNINQLAKQQEINVAGHLYWYTYP